MAINYEFFETPNPTGDGTKTYHPRVVSYGSISTDTLAKEIQDACTLTRADVKAVLVSLADKMAQYLSYGQKIHLEGIGYIGVSLKCPKKISNKEDMKHAPVMFKAVTFRADEELKQKMQRVKMERSSIRVHSAQISEEGIDRKLTEHFAKEAIITRSSFQHLCNLCESTAYRHIKRLVEEGKLQNVSTPRNPVYMPCEGWYRK